MLSHQRRPFSESKSKSKPPEANPRKWETQEEKEANEQGFKKETSQRCRLLTKKEDR